MRKLTDLIRAYPYVWIFCRTEDLQIQFLNQLETEGFKALNGQNPTELFHHQLYGINDDMTMGYLSSMIWVFSARNACDDPIRVDYEKYITDEDDYFVKM